MTGIRRPAAPRDQHISPFARILEGFCRAHPRVFAAAFVDGEGECIDYFSLVDPFEAKVAGAHLVATLAALGDNCQAVGLGQPRLWMIEATRRDMLMVRAAEGYVVVLLLEPKGLNIRVLNAVDSLIEALGREAGLELEPDSCVEVEAERSSAGSRMTPLALFVAGERVPIVRVLARWQEAGMLSGERVSCYRVALPERELTLLYEPRLNDWRIRPTARDIREPRRPKRKA